jgi:signal transduction histidine kinase
MPVSPLILQTTMLLVGVSALVLALVTSRQRRLPGAAVFTLLMAVVGFMMLSTGISANIDNPAIRTFFFRLSALAGFHWVMALLISLHLTGKRAWITPVFVIAICVVPLLLALLLLLAPVQQVTLAEFKLWYLIYIIYASVVTCVIGWLGFREIRHVPTQHHPPIILWTALMVGMLPMDLWDFSTGPAIDVLVYYHAVGQVVAWILVMHYRFLQTTTIAREQLIDILQDAMWVLDADGRILEMNAMAERVLQTPLAVALGRSLSEYAPSWVSAQSVASPSVALNLAEHAVTIDGHPRTYQLQLIPLFDTGGMIGYLLYGRDITEVRTHERFRMLTTDLSSTVEMERQHIARYLHDEVGQSLAGTILYLDQLAPALPAGEPAAAHATVRRLLAETLEHSRALTMDLCPEVLLQQGFSHAVHWVVQRMMQRYPLKIAYLDDGQACAVPRTIGLHLLSMIRELLFNVVKHAHTRQATVSTLVVAQSLRIIVDDDGVGCRSDARSQRDGFGLFSIHERVRQLGGTLTITSAPGDGTNVTLEIPLSTLQRESTDAETSGDRR